MMRNGVNGPLLTLGFKLSVKSGHLIVVGSRFSRGLMSHHASETAYKDGAAGSKASKSNVPRRNLWTSSCGILIMCRRTCPCPCCILQSLYSFVMLSVLTLASRPRRKTRRRKLFLAMRPKPTFWIEKPVFGRLVL